MKPSEKEKILDFLSKVTDALKIILILALVISASAVYIDRYYDPSHFNFLTEQPEKETGPPVVLDSAGDNHVENGVHVASGLIDDVNLNLVITNCTACHSAKLITQNRASREGWESMIRWMQETQKLWDLGENEALILDYLAKNYAPQNQGRRAPLTGIEWYELDEQ